jgi:stage V sporulation protein SpoVS
MKKTSSILSLIIFLLGSGLAQSCAKTTKNKVQSSVAVLTVSAKSVPAESAGAIATKPQEKTVETMSTMSVDKAVVPVIDTTKMAQKNEVETVTATTQPVRADASPMMDMPKTTMPAGVTQVVDNKPITVKKSTQKPTKMLGFDHSVWNDLLKKHVSATGKVDYKGFKTDLELLDAYMRSLNENAPTENASKDERFAYWINAYNAVTVRLIVGNYPLTSITKLDGGKPWDVKRYSNGSKKISLNDIENNILRPMGDARIHFALNCAAKSCPPLLNEAFTGDNVQKLLEQRTKQFINSSRTVVEKDGLKVSKIFEWYAKDFGNVVDFVNKYAKVKAAKTAKVTYLEYDWGLNE